MIEALPEDVPASDFAQLDTIFNIISVFALLYIIKCRQQRALCSA